MGTLNALTGQVTFVDGYIVGRQKVIDCYRGLIETYPRAERISPIQDKGSIDKHPDVLQVPSLALGLVWSPGACVMISQHAL
jgi:hypothetical protein